MLIIVDQLCRDSLLICSSCSQNFINSAHSHPPQPWTFNLTLNRVLADLWYHLITLIQGLLNWGNSMMLRYCYMLYLWRHWELEARAKLRGSEGQKFPSKVQSMSCFFYFWGLRSPQKSIKHDINFALRIMLVSAYCPFCSSYVIMFVIEFSRSGHVTDFQSFPYSPRSPPPFSETYLCKKNLCCVRHVRFCASWLVQVSWKCVRDVMLHRLWSV